MSCNFVGFKDGMTAIHLAARHNRLEIVMFLVSVHADFNKKTNVSSVTQNQKPSPSMCKYKP